jgi:hypothetical protein
MPKIKDIGINDIGKNIEDDGFSNILGGCWPNCEKKWREENEKFVLTNVGDLSNGASCSQIDSQIEKIQNEMNSVNGKIAAGDKSKRWKNALFALENKMKEAKNLRSLKKCQELKEKQEKELEQAQNIKILEETTKSATSKDEIEAIREKIEAAKGSKADYTKYIAIGIGGILVIGAVILLFKPSKK